MARKIRETYFIKNNANDNVGMTAIFYSDGTYSIVTGVTISGFKNFLKQGQIFLMEVVVMCKEPSPTPFKIEEKLDMES